MLPGVQAIAVIGNLVPGPHQGLRQELAQGFIVFDQKDVRHSRSAHGTKTYKPISVNAG
jgi:hypothetical protein